MGGLDKYKKLGLIDDVDYRQIDSEIKSRLQEDIKNSKKETEKIMSKFTPQDWVDFMFNIERKSRGIEII